MSDKTKKAGHSISFWFSPLNPENKLHVVEKSENDGDTKRRYLKGVTSGMKVDGHGERMTKACIEKMQTQAKSGEILLFEGQHAVNLTDDIGRLIGSEITPAGDWITTYRLYDEKDGFEKGSVTLEKADKLWNQMNGFPPYEKASPRGFSIEGFIPEGGIMEMNEEGVRTKINEVDLDGVVVVKRPSYQSSVAAAIRKALDELSPEAHNHITDNIRGRFLNLIADEQVKESYYNKRWKLDDALNDAIEEAVSKGIQMKERLEIVLQEYSRLLVELIIQHQGVFVRPPDEPDIPEQGAIDVAKANRLRILKGVQDQIAAYVNCVRKRKPAKRVAKKIKGEKYGRNNNKRISARRKNNS